MKMFWGVVLGVSFHAFAFAQDGSATAEQATRYGDAGWGWTGDLALEFGGDDVATVSFTDGSTQDVKAGQGVAFAIGGHYRRSEFSPYDFRATIGYKYVTTQATNADITLTRFTYEFSAIRNLNQKWWLGGSLIHHSNISFDADGLGPDGDFEDSTGFGLRVGYGIFALAYKKLSYTPEGGSDDFDASNIGFQITGNF